MPAMGESVSEGVILEWAKQPGDAVEADETIVEISTDKVDAEVPAPASGVMGEILANAGDTVTVGQVIGRMKSGGQRREARRRRRPAPRPGHAEPAAEPGSEEVAARRHPHLARRAPRRRRRGRRPRRASTAAAPAAASSRPTCSAPQRQGRRRAPAPRRRTPR